MTHYQILEIAETAGPEMIEAAWKVQMRGCHPDRKGVKSTKRAQAVNEAHDVLSDPQKRAAYDQQLLSKRERREPTRDTPHEQQHYNGIRFDGERGFYPPAYGEPIVEIIQSAAQKIGETFLGELFRQNPGVQQVLNNANKAAAKGAMKRK